MQTNTHANELSAVPSSLHEEPYISLESEAWAVKRIYLIFTAFPYHRRLAEQIRVLSKTLGFCFATQNTLAKYTRLDVQKVSVFTKQMANKGLLTIERQPDSSNKITLSEDTKRALYIMKKENLSAAERRKREKYMVRTGLPFQEFVPHKFRALIRARLKPGCVAMFDELCDLGYSSSSAAAIASDYPTEVICAQIADPYWRETKQPLRFLRSRIVANSHVGPGARKRGSRKIEAAEEESGPNCGIQVITSS